MKFSCVKDNLERAVSLAERFTGKNITMPILGNLLLEASENSLGVSATNLEYALRAEIPGKGTKGRVSVPARVMSSLLSSMREEKLVLEEKQGNLVLTTDTRTIRVQGMPPEEFPLLPRIKKAFSLVLPGEDLSRGLEKVLPAVSTSEFKPELAGVLWRVDPGSVRLAATDTFRLAEYTLKREGGLDSGSASFILPRTVAQELARVAGPEDVRISVGENQIMAETAGTVIISRLIEGNFPDYTGIVPKNFSATAFISRDEMVAAVRSSSIFASKIQEVAFRFFKNGLEVASQNPDVGEHKITVPVAMTGKDNAVSFNYRYLLDGLGALDEEELFFGANADNAPSLIRNKSDGSFLYIVMPIRLT